VRTLITDGNELFINTTGNLGMVTAGIGDVLAGIIGELVVQKMSLIEAITQGDYILRVSCLFCRKASRKRFVNQ